jgi:hypothetical protein
MHTLLALTMMHQRFTNSQVSQQPSHEEALHHFRSISLFNARMSISKQPTGIFEAAALWVSGALISTIAFANIQSLDPELNWPLRSSSSSDLSWLIIAEGKSQLFSMTQSLKGDAQFSRLFPPQTSHVLHRTSMATQLNALPKCLLELCNLAHGPDEDDNNPYRHAAASLAASQDTDFASALIIFFAFIGNISSSFKALLHRKDARALLLLAMWYARLRRIEIWWLQPRALVEGHAICIYLRRYHGHDVALQHTMKVVWRECFGLWSIRDDEMLFT